MSAFLCAVLTLTVLYPVLFDDTLVGTARRHGGKAIVYVDVLAPVLSLPEMATTSDLIVHGTIIAERGRLGAGNRAVFTEYDIVPYRIVKKSLAAAQSGPTVQAPIRAVLPGGTAHHEGLEIQVTINTLPHAERLRWGAEVVLFLTLHESEPGIFRVEGGGQGAFRVIDGQVIAMTRAAAAARSDKPEPLESFLDRVQRLVGGLGAGR